MAIGGRVELADILRIHGQAWLAGHTLGHSQAKAWRAIVACRTAALGGHIEQCDSCGTVRHVFHSCRNRHCPKCQTRAKEQWIAARNRELLPVPYVHLVLTIPHALNGLAGSHFRLITDILFAAASQTLTGFGANPRWLGGMLAFSLVLHTWTQNLLRHLHVHALVANGALGADGQWITGKRGFLFPVKALSKVFREKFIDALKQARHEQRLDNALDETGWRALLAALRQHDWVVYAKEPLGGPAQVLDYLGRYTHKTAISNERVVTVRDGQVLFRVREREHAGKKRIESLPVDTFIGRFMSHVLPSGFKRIRHYGVLANCHKREQLARCRTTLGMPAPEPKMIEAVDAFMRRVASIDIAHCTCCAHGQFRLIAVISPSRLAHCARGPPP